MVIKRCLLQVFFFSKSYHKGCDLQTNIGTSVDVYHTDIIHLFIQIVHPLHLLRHSTEINAFLQVVLSGILGITSGGMLIKCRGITLDRFHIVSIRSLYVCAVGICCDLKRTDTKQNKKNFTQQDDNQSCLSLIESLVIYNNQPTVDLRAYSNN